MHVHPSRPPQRNIWNVDLDFIQIPTTTTHLTINIPLYYNNNLNVKSILFDIPYTTTQPTKKFHVRIIHVLVLTAIVIVIIIIEQKLKLCTFPRIQSIIVGRKESRGAALRVTLSNDNLKPPAYNN